MGKMMVDWGLGLVDRKFIQQNYRLNLPCHFEAGVFVKLFEGLKCLAGMTFRFLMAPALNKVIQRVILEFSWRYAG